jgi:hypothetical protein
VFSSVVHKSRPPGHAGDEIFCSWVLSMEVAPRILTGILDFCKICGPLVFVRLRIFRTSFMDFKNIVYRLSTLMFLIKINFATHGPNIKSALRQPESQIEVVRRCFETRHSYNELYVPHTHAYIYIYIFPSYLQVLF